MTTFPDAACAGRRLAIVLAVVAAVGVQAQSPEELARRRLESGRAFLASGNYDEALRDFEAVLQSYPTSAVADESLLEIATYHLDVAGNLPAAAARIKELQATYPNSDSMPRALILDGRIALAQGHGVEQVSAAIASFDRVTRLFPGNEAIPEAMYLAGEASRVARRDDAVERFGGLAVRYPTSRWTARALLGSAAALTAAGQPQRAMEQLQRVRTQFPGLPEAATALEWNTILYRLHVRAPAHAPYAYSGSISYSGGRFRNVSDLAVDRQNRLFVAAGTGVIVFDAQGAVVQSRGVPPQLRALMPGPRDTLQTAHETGVVRSDGGTDVTLALPGADGRPRPVKIDAGVTSSFGEHLVAVREQRAVLRFSSTGEPRGEVVTQVTASRLALSELDDLAVLDANAKSVAVLTRDGRTVARLAERGTGYQFRRPVDVAFDRLGYLYVLDRGAVFVFAPQASRLVATFTVPDRAPGAFGNPAAMALDSAARLFVFDGRSSQVQVYK